MNTNQVPTTSCVDQSTDRPTSDSTASANTVSGRPRMWLRVEALVLLVGAMVTYSTTGQHC